MADIALDDPKPAALREYIATLMPTAKANTHTTYASALRSLGKHFEARTIGELAAISSDRLIAHANTKNSATRTRDLTALHTILVTKLQLKEGAEGRKLQIASVSAGHTLNDEMEKNEVQLPIPLPEFRQKVAAAVQKYSAMTDADLSRLTELRLRHLVIFLMSLSAPQRPHVFQNTKLVFTQADFDRIRAEGQHSVFLVPELVFYTPTSKTGKTITADFKDPRSHPELLRRALNAYINKKRGGRTHLFDVTYQALLKAVPMAFNALIDTHINAQAIRRYVATLDGETKNITSGELAKRAQAMGHSVEMHLKYRALPKDERPDNVKAAYKKVEEELARLLDESMMETSLRKLNNVLRRLKNVKV